MVFYCCCHEQYEQSSASPQQDCVVVAMRTMQECHVTHGTLERQVIYEHCLSCLSECLSVVCHVYIMVVKYVMIGLYSVTILYNVLLCTAFLVEWYNQAKRGVFVMIACFGIPCRHGEHGSLCWLTAQLAC